MEQSSQILMHQPRLKKGGLILMLALMDAAAPLSTDLYMPSLPSMVTFFHSSNAMINMTLSMFFLFFAFGMLIFGPLSDKFGRKRTLLAGVGIYTAASVLCAFSANIWIRIIFRIIQALGAGSMVSISMAIIRDSFMGRIQERLMSLVNAMTGLVPIAAPILGALLLKKFAWHASFVVLALCGIGEIVLILLYKETLPAEKRINESVFSTMKHLFVVLKNRDFTLFLFSTALVNLPFLAYISSSSFVYVNGFGLTESGYSMFFALTCVLSLLGPLSFARFGKKRPIRKTITLICLEYAAAACILAVHFRSALLYALTIALMLGCMAFGRGFVSSTLLSLQKKDIGAASALINFVYQIAGATGSFLITAVFTDYPIGVGTLLIITTSISVVCFIAFLKTGGKHRLQE